MDKITIIDKSGTKIHAQVDKAVATHLGHREFGEFTADIIIPKPLFFGTKDVESIWRGHI